VEEEQGMVSCHLQLGNPENLMLQKLGVGEAKVVEFFVCLLF